MEGEVDVIVADGYSGNIFLKTMEGTGGFMAKQLKAMFKKNLLTKLAAVLVSGGLKRFKEDDGRRGGGRHPPHRHLQARHQGPRLLRRLRLPERHPPGPASPSPPV